MVNYEDENIDHLLSTEEVENRKNKKKDDVNLYAEDLKSILSSKYGRRFIWNLLEDSGIFSISFNQNPLIMSFNEGSRNFGLRMLALINEAEPEKYTEMLNESKELKNNGK